MYLLEGVHRDAPGTYAAVIERRDGGKRIYK